MTMCEQVIVVPERVRLEARFIFRIIAGDPKPAVAKIGEYWVSWDGRGRVRPFLTWRGALRSVLT